MMSSLFGRGAPADGSLGLQVAIDEVDLLQPAQALADLFCSDLAHALDAFQLRVGRRQQLVQPTELFHDVRDDQLGQSWDSPEDPVAAGRHRIVESVELAV